MDRRTFLMMSSAAAGAAWSAHLTAAAVRAEAPGDAPQVPPNYGDDLFRDDFSGYRHYYLFALTGGKAARRES